MTKTTYRFIDLHLSEWVKFFMTLIVFSILMLIFFALPIWIIPTVFLIAFLFVYVMHRTKITVVGGIKNSSLFIQNVQSRVQLYTPLTADVWWNYSMKDSVLQLSDGTPRMGPRANTINVYLEVTDMEGQKVTFKEKIIFGGRFPNEANYVLENMDTTSREFNVQRVDKLIEFLKKYIQE